MQTSTLSDSSRQILVGRKRKPVPIIDLSTVTPEGLLAANHRRELRRLNDVAFVFLEATGGDVGEAERLLDDAVDLLFEGGVLSTWRYRIVLAQVREGL